MDIHAVRALTRVRLARVGFLDARRAFTDAVVAANDAGASTRNIARLCSMSHSTIARLIRDERARTNGGSH